MKYLSLIYLYIAYSETEESEPKYLIEMVILILLLVMQTQLDENTCSNILGRVHQVH